MNSSFTSSNQPYVQQNRRKSFQSGMQSGMNSGLNQSFESHLRRKSVPYLRNLEPHLFSKAILFDRQSTLNKKAESFKSCEYRSNSFTMEVLSTSSSTKHSTTYSKSRNGRVSPFFREPLKPILEKNKMQLNKSIYPQTVKEKEAMNLKIRKQSQEARKEPAVHTKHCKELVNQVQTLQNRIKKLKEEEEIFNNKINETAVETQKVLDTKKQHKESLINKITRGLKNSLELHRRKKEILKERENQKQALYHTSEANLKSKQENANNIKLDNKLHKMRKEENQHNQMEKNKELINKVKTAENMFMRSQLVKQANSKSGPHGSDAEKIQNKKKSAESLEKRLKELSLVEEQLVRRLNHTYSLHRVKFEELEKAYSLHVSPLNPVSKNIGLQHSKIQECSFNSEMEDNAVQMEKNEKVEVLRS